MSRKLLGRLTRLWGSFRPSSLVKSPNLPSSKLTPVTTLPLHPQLLFLLHLHHLQASLHPREPPIPPFSWPAHCQLITPNPLMQQPPLQPSTQSLFRLLSLPIGRPQLTPSSSPSHQEG